MHLQDVYPSIPAPSSIVLSIKNNYKVINTLARSLSRSIHIVLSQFYAYLCLYIQMRIVQDVENNPLKQNANSKILVSPSTVEIINFCKPNQQIVSGIPQKGSQQNYKKIQEHNASEIKRIMQIDDLVIVVIPNSSQRRKVYLAQISGIMRNKYLLLLPLSLHCTNCPQLNSTIQSLDSTPQSGQDLLTKDEVQQILHYTLQRTEGNHLRCRVAVVHKDRYLIL